MIRQPVRMVCDGHTFEIIIYGDDYNHIHQQAKKFVSQHNDNLKDNIVKGDDKTKILHCYSIRLSGGGVD